MTGSFYRNSDVNQLYVKRTEGGRGLKSFKDSFKTHVVALSGHIRRDRERNHLLHNIYRHDEQGFMRIAKEYEDIYIPRNEEGQTNTREEKISDRVKNKINEQNKENIFHVIASCSHLSSNLYLNARHKPVAQALYNDIVADFAKAERTNSYKKPDPVTRTRPLKIWRDRVIQTATKVLHNRPDLVVWNAKYKKCQIIDVCISLNIDVGLRHIIKRDNYTPLVDQMHQLYPGYSIQIFPVVIRALGTIPKKLKENLEIIEQKISLLGTLKILKNFQKYERTNKFKEASNERLEL